MADVASLNEVEVADSGSKAEEAPVEVEASKPGTSSQSPTKTDVYVTYFTNCLFFQSSFLSTFLLINDCFFDRSSNNHWNSQKHLFMGYHGGYLLYTEHMSHVKQMFSPPMHFTHELMSCIRITIGRVHLNKATQKHLY